MALQGIGLDGVYYGWESILWMCCLYKNSGVSQDVAEQYLSSTYLAICIYYTRMASCLLYTTLHFDFPVTETKLMSATKQVGWLESHNPL